MSAKDFIGRKNPLPDRQTIMEHGLAGFVTHIDLKRERLEWCIRHEVFQQSLNVFLTRFPDAVPVKGMSLIPRVYKDPSLREVTDIDLYYPFDLKPVENYLRQEGFEIDRDQWEGNDYKLNARKTFHGIEVPFEIHQKLLWTANETWEVVETESGKTLRPEDELVYLCGHLVYQHTMLSLHWLVDIDLLIRENKNWDYDRIAFLVSSLPLKTSLSSALWCIQHHFGTDPGAVLSKFILSDFRNRIIQRLLTEDFMWKTIHAKGAYYLLKHLFKDTFQDAVKYDFLWFRNVLKEKLERP